jgi:REP element-mobilizing transposase RayT
MIHSLARRACMRGTAMAEPPFNADDPIAFFITWTTYGTWLPGDERGWQQWGKGGVQAPNEFLKKTAESKMKVAEFELSNQDRKIVKKTIEKHCEIRNWTLHKVNARSNHVHVVVTAPGYDPETVRDQFKAWCTRKLKASHSHRERFWTEGASCRSINHEEDLVAAIEYAGDGQERKYLE